MNTHLVSHELLSLGRLWHAFRNVEECFLGYLHNKHDLNTKDAKKQKGKKKAGKKPADFDAVGLDYDTNDSECTTFHQN